jgi:hypothetical protein
VERVFEYHEILEVKKTKLVAIKLRGEEPLCMVGAAPGSKIAPWQDQSAIVGQNEKEALRAVSTL